MNIVLLGGNYQKESQVNVGPMIAKGLEGIHVDKLFIGTDGFNEISGFTGNDMLRSEAVKTMSKHASRVMIITESKKFDKAGLVQLLPLSSISCIYTDLNIPIQYENYLNQHNVKVIKA